MPQPSTVSEERRIENVGPPLDEAEPWLGEQERLSEDGRARFRMKIGGLHCSFCTATIRKALTRREGVEDASVSLAHEEGLVTYDPDLIGPRQIVETLRDVGYEVRDPGKVRTFEDEEAELRRERDRFLAGLAASSLALALMVLSWTGNQLVLELAGESFVAGPWILLGVATATILVAGRHVLKMAWASARRGILNQHVLLEAGAWAGLIGGLLGLFVAPQTFPAGEHLAVATFITTYHLLSGYVASLVRTRAGQSVRKLLDLQPDTARVIRDGEAVEVPVAEVEAGERVRVRPGERIPLDGEVVSGHSTVDESMVTGEPVPAEKGEGSELIYGSVNQAGALAFQVTRVGRESFLAQVARHIEEARALKPGVIQLVDRILKVYVPSVLGFAGLAFAVWTLGAWAVTGEPDVSRAIFATLAVLVLGYPCALGMATPLAMMRGGGIAAEQGILMRSGEAFQIFGEIRRAVFDKTGTLTVGRPRVVALAPSAEVEATELLAVAAAAEEPSEHPLARAIVDAADERALEVREADGFESETGQGVSAGLDGRRVAVGKPEWIESRRAMLDGLAPRRREMEGEAQTVIAVAADGRLLGLIGIADEVKSDAADAVARLRDAGIGAVMLTGDNERTARAVASRVGIEEVRAEVMPQDKAEAVRELQEEGERVMMVGDGINDAPALTQADIGIAIGAGTDIAIESSDVVLVGERVDAVAEAREIGAGSYAKTKQNLAVAFSFNGIGVPAAATGLIGPIWAMVAMVSSVTAVLANSFGARLGPRSVISFGCFLGRWASRGAASLRTDAWRAALTPGAGLAVALLVGSVGLGVLWVVALGHPGPGT